MEFTPVQIQEFVKCKGDPVYFCKNYIKIVSLDEGLVPFGMYDFQEDMVNKFHENRFRQSLKIYSGTQSVSNFRPTAAKLIYEKYLFYYL